MSNFKSLISSRLFVLCLYIALILVRAPDIVWPGRFWAEEGAIYFREAYTSPPLTVLTTANLGYYSLLNKIASLAAVHTVPLRFAPVITVLFALVVQILPAWLLLFSRIPSLKSRFYQICAIFVVLLIQPNQGVWLNTINSQFFLCVATAIILISHATNRLSHVVRLGILALAGLTGVVSSLLLPFFWIEYLWTRNKRKLLEAMVLTSAGIVQVAIVFAVSGRDTHWYLSYLPFVLFSKQWLLPTVGSGVVDLFSAYVIEHQIYEVTLLGLALLVPYIVLGLGLIRWGNRHSWFLLAASIFLASFFFLYSIEAQRADWILTHLSAVGASRYYYAPNVLLALAVLMPLKDHKVVSTAIPRYFRIGCIILVGLMITIGVHDYVTSQQRHEWFFSGPSWPREVEKWQENNQEKLDIWPSPWSMDLSAQTRGECRVEQRPWTNGGGGQAEMITARRAAATPLLQLPHKALLPLRQRGVADLAPEIMNYSRWIQQH